MGQKGNAQKSNHCEPVQACSRGVNRHGKRVQGAQPPAWRRQPLCWVLGGRASVGRGEGRGAARGGGNGRQAAEQAKAQGRSAQAVLK